MEEPNTLTTLERDAKAERSPWLLRGILLMFLLIFAGMGYVMYLFGPTGNSAQIRIPKGSGAATVGRILEKAGIVRSQGLFALYLRISHRDKDLKPGFYRLQGNGLRAVAVALTDKSRPLTVKVTFPEGWRAVDIAERLTENNLDGPGVLELVQNPTSDQRPAGATGPTLEGFLFPATYEFPLDASAEDVLRILTGRAEQEFSTEAKEKLAKLGIKSVQDWVTLASVVQAEAANAAEKPAIAGIFLNRLEIGMPLQADPTVAYGLNKRLPELDRGAGDFEKDTPYNTYLHKGLPPTAINNPGEDALKAILNPTRTNAQGKKNLYFLHAQGKLYLNSDFQGHLRDTNLYYR